MGIHYNRQSSLQSSRTVNWEVIASFCLCLIICHPIFSPAQCHCFNYQKHPVWVKLLTYISNKVNKIYEKKEAIFSIQYLLFLNRLKDLDNASLLVWYVYAFKDLTVFPSSNFPNNLIIILVTRLQNSTHYKWDFAQQWL